MSGYVYGGRDTEPEPREIVAQVRAEMARKQTGRGGLRGRR
jgi:hypothetical protein